MDRPRISMKEYNLSHLLIVLSPVHDENLRIMHRSRIVGWGVGSNKSEIEILF